MSVAAQQTALPHRARVDVARALKGAAVTALMSFFLFLPLIGFRTVQNMRNELELETRFPLLLAIVALITAAKLTGSRAIEPWRARRALRPAVALPKVPVLKAAFVNWFTPFALGFVVIYP